MPLLSFMFLIESERNMVTKVDQEQQILDKMHRNKVSLGMIRTF